MSRSLCQWALGLVVVAFLSSCGDNGDSNVAPSNVAPTASIRLSANVPVGSLVTIDGTGSGGAGGKPITFAWVMTARPTGSAAALSDATASQPTFTPDVAGVYSFTLTVNDGSKSSSVSGSTTAAATTTPTTILSDVVEPLAGGVIFSLSDSTAASANWTVDGVSIGTGVSSVVWDSTTVADGQHTVSAHLLYNANFTVDISRVIQVTQGTVNFNSQTITEATGQYTATVGATSPNGILHVDASLDGVAVGTLAAPNVCIGDTTGAACANTGLNGYSFSGSVTNGTHVVLITATDGVGHTLSIQLRMINLTDAPS